MLYAQIFFKPVLKAYYQNLCETIETNSLVHEAVLLATFSREKEKDEKIRSDNTDLTKLHLSECFQSHLSPSLCNSKASCTHSQRSHLSSEFVYVKLLVFPWQTWAPWFVRTQPATVVWHDSPSTHAFVRLCLHLPTCFISSLRNIKAWVDLLS